MKTRPNLISSKQIYKDTHIQVIHDKLKHRGFLWNQVYLRWKSKETVCVIPFEKDGVYLIRQYRHAIGKYVWQFPGGIMEKGKTKIAMAKQELLEETGFVASNVSKIGEFFPEAGLVASKVNVFLARGLTRGKRQLEKSEIDMTLRFFSLKRIELMIKKGKIRDGISLTGYLLLRFLL